MPTGDEIMNRSAPTARSLRAPVLTGIAVVLTFFAGFGAFTALAPLSGAAIAPGVVSPDGNRKTVQHLEGGIIRQILVEDGRKVAAGEPLVRLDDTATKADHDRLRARHRALAASQARLLAEQTGAERIIFPAALAATEDPEIAALRGAEVSRFETRRTALAGRQAILRQRVAELQEEIGGLEAEIASQSEQQRLIDEEARSVADLVGRGLERKPRLLALERGRAQIEGQRAQNQAAIARARQAIGEAELQILSLASTRQDEIATELGSMRAELLDIDEQLRASADVLARTVIAAPVAGTVVGLRFRTPGGVIGAGEPILDLVPADDQLLVRRPGDADRHRRRPSRTPRPGPSARLPAAHHAADRGPGSPDLGRQPDRPEDRPDLFRRPDRDRPPAAELPGTGDRPHPRHAGRGPDPDRQPDPVRGAARAGARGLPEGVAGDLIPAHCPAMF
jgi:membrane fusion protein, type I secretion system